MPFTEVPVRLAPLRRDPVSGAVTALVRFPDDWVREACVVYTSEEQFMLFQSELQMNGEAYRPGVRVTVPGGAPRGARPVPRAARSRSRGSRAIRLR
jgi:hypothetical protein